jgi:hypothetical protein
MRSHKLFRINNIAISNRDKNAPLKKQRRSRIKTKFLDCIAGNAATGQLAAFTNALLKSVRARDTRFPQAHKPSAYLRRIRRQRPLALSLAAFFDWQLTCPSL